MAVFPHSLRKVFIGSGAVRTTGSTSDLKAGELGLFDAETFRALTTGATYTSNPKVILAQGSFHQKDVLALGHGGLKESIKSRPIHGAHVTEWRFAAPTRAQNHVITIGYDGVDTDKTIEVEKDKTYKLRVTVKGSPVSRFINHDIYHDFIYTTECPEDCTDNCSDPTSANPLVEDIVKQINEHPYISPFVKAEALYGDLAAIPSVEQTVYQLSVCDTGDAAALAEVQRQYPTRSVSRVSRTGSVSVYEICIPAADDAPVDFSNENLRVIPNCTTCPTGYTLVAKLYKFEVKREDAGSGGALTTVTSDYTSSPAAVRVSYELGTSTYIIYKSAATVPAAVGTDLVLQAGSLDSVCTLDTPGTTEWVEAGTKYKTTRTLTLTLAKTCGGANRLTDLQAFYANEPTRASAISVATAGACGDVYTTTQYNNECLEDPCESHDNPTFVTFQSFEGAVWEATDIEFGEADTPVGIRLSSAYVETKFGDCSFDPLDHYDLEIPKIYVSQIEEDSPTTSLAGGDRCSAVWPVTELQNPKYASGTGEYVKRELIDFMRYKQEEFFTPQGSRMNETQDINSWISAVDVKKFYKIYYLVYNVPYTNRRTNLFDNEEYELMVVFPEEADTSTFENLINGYVTSVGVQLKAV
jgi:hypothetical protein